MNANPSSSATLTGAEPPLPGKLALSAAQQKQFQDNGFFVLPGLLTEQEIEKYIAVIDRADREITVDQKGERTPGTPLELRNAVTFDPSLVDLLSHRRALPYISDLMGPDIAMTTSHIFIRPTSPAGVGAGYKQIGWHRDGPARRPLQVNGNEPWLYTKIGYFLTDLTIPNAGALRVVPGSHRYGGPPPQAGPDAEPYGSIEVKVKAGDAVIFENRVLHAVGPNYADIARKNIYIGYCWRYLRPIDYVSQSPELLANADAVQRQLLGETSSGLGYYLPQPEDVPLAGWYQQEVQTGGNI